jgi:hypothetical protein
MLKNKNLILFSGFLCLAGMLYGCGTKKIENTGVPPGAPSNEAPAQKASLEGSGHYFVQRNDCLWEIAGKPSIFGDSFEWPLLFKANRDEIRDPDLIYPRQDLRVQKDIPMEERNHARQMASATPKYVPHSAPRETLPVDYF